MESAWEVSMRSLHWATRWCMESRRCWTLPMVMSSWSELLWSSPQSPEEEWGRFRQWYFLLWCVRYWALWSKRSHIVLSEKRPPILRFWSLQLVSATFCRIWLFWSSEQMPRALLQWLTFRQWLCLTDSLSLKESRSLRLLSVLSLWWLWPGLYVKPSPDAPCRQFLRTEMQLS